MAVKLSPVAWELGKIRTLIGKELSRGKTKQSLLPSAREIREGWGGVCGGGEECVGGGGGGVCDKPTQKP